MQLELARHRAQEFVLDELVEDAKAYLAVYGQDVDRERGGCPQELAAVLGVLHMSEDDVWAIPRREAQRLGAWPGVPAKVRFWAGLRLVNEAMSAVERSYPPLSSRVHWSSVCLVLALGKQVFGELVRLARGPGAVPGWLRSHDPPAGLGLDPGAIVYRGAMAPARVAAAEVLHGGELPVTPAILLPAPDDRLRRGIARATSLLWVVGQVASCGEVSGLWDRVAARLTR
jgi:hypothetical protein